MRRITGFARPSVRHPIVCLSGCTVIANNLKLENKKN